MRVAAAATAARSRSKNCGDGVHSPISRWAIVRDGHRRRLGQRAIHELRATVPTRNAPVMSLPKTKRSSRSSRCHAARSRACTLGARQARERQPARSFDPGGERRVVRARSGGGSSSAIVSARSPTASYAGFEQPRRNAGGCDRRLAQVAAADEPLQLAAGEEVHRPRDVVRRRAAEVAGEGGHLLARARRRVERHEQRGEAAHAERASVAPRPQREPKRADQERLVDHVDQQRVPAERGEPSRRAGRAARSAQSPGAPAK